MLDSGLQSSGSTFHVAAHTSGCVFTRQKVTKNIQKLEVLDICLVKDNERKVKNKIIDTVL